MAVKARESFERNIAYIMTNAGFYINPDQPHQVKLEGKVVGDIDILAVDPKSDTSIGVTCKNWETNPESKDFNHFVSMMEIENLTHGVLAWIHVPASVFPLIQNATKKGFRFVVIDRSRYEELHHFMLTGQHEKIEGFFRYELALESVKTPTLADEIALRKAPSGQRRPVACSNLLPLNHGLDPPTYIKNCYFKPVEGTKLLVRPYLTAVLYVQKEGKVPRTGEVQRRINQEVTMIADAITGKYPQEGDPIAHLLTSHYTEALKHHTIEEDGFTTEVREPKINKQEMVYKMRVDLARTTEPLEVRWTEYRRDGEEVKRSKTIEVTPSDIRELHSSIVNVPIWHVRYRKGAYNYVREFLATDGTALKDDMAKCMLCDEPTIAVCYDCGLVACENHINACKTCGEFFCNTDSIHCVNCKSQFCKTHAEGQSCIICEGFVCSTDDARCVTCNKTVCREHTISCTECGKTVCEEHRVEARYVAVKKRFCSETCHSKYNAEYKQKGLLGKLGKVAKRR